MGSAPAIDRFWLCRLSYLLTLLVVFYAAFASAAIPKKIVVPNVPSTTKVITDKKTSFSSSAVCSATSIATSWSGAKNGFAYACAYSHPNLQHALAWF